MFMAVDKKAVAAGIAKAGKRLIEEVSKSETLQRQIFGSYTDGKPRSLTDAITGEIHSPKEKAKMEAQIKKSKKKKKKKESVGQRYAKINL